MANKNKLNISNNKFSRFYNNTVLIILIYLTNVIFCSEIIDEVGGGLHKLEGKVINQYTADDDWIEKAKVYIDGGLFIGFIRIDGSFVINAIPSGSYVFEVVHPLFYFDPIRIEITSKGKIRARALDNIQPFQVKNIVAYPLKIRCRGRLQYFQQREQWRLSDFLFNPMVLMMFLPLVLMFILPKLMNSQDPEVQKEMQQSMSWMSPKSNLPDLSEFMTNLLGSNKPNNSPQTTAVKKSSKARIKQK